MVQEKQTIVYQEAFALLPLFTTIQKEEFHI